MFCENCGSILPENAAFCSECGAKCNISGQAQPPVMPGWQPNPAQSPVQKKSRGKKAKEGKKSPVKIIIALVLVVALVVCGIIFVPGLLKGGKIDVKENVFAAEAKEVGKKADSYEALNMLALVQNTLFNSESFSFSIADAVKGKIAFGKDVPSTEFYFNLDDEFYAAMYNGTFLGTDGWDAVRVDIGGVLKDADTIVDSYMEEYEKQAAMAKEEGWEIDLFPQYLASHSDEIKNVAISAIKDKRINLNPVMNTLVDAFLSIMADRINYEFGSDIVGKYPSFETLYKMAAEFIGTLSSDVLSVEKSSDGGTDTYSFKFNLVDLADELLHYQPFLDVLQEFFGIAYQEIYEDMLEELDYYMQDDDKSDYDISGKLVAEDNYVSSVKLTIYGETGKITISDVNATKITEGDYEKVEKNTDDCEIQEIDDGYDIIDIFM